MEAFYNLVERFEIEAVCQSPLHVGNADGIEGEVLIHPVEHVPFVQATSLAGVFRNYYSQSYGEADCEALFGSKKTIEKDDGQTEQQLLESKIKFSDGHFCETEEYPLKMELRARLEIDNETGSCRTSDVNGTSIKSGHKFEMQYVGAGAKIQFSIFILAKDHPFQKQIQHCLEAMNAGDMQIGGQKSTGCGYLKILCAKYRKYDMTEKDDLKAWIDEIPLSDNYKLTLEEKPGKWSYAVTVSACTESELSIKSASLTDYNKNLLAVNIQNAKGDYIIPGSSIKGVIRNRMEMIAEYTGHPFLIPYAFGSKSENNGNGKPGILKFYDTVVGKTEENDLAPLRSRIWIDKFTGTAMAQKLFREKNISGDLSIHITIKESSFADAVCGLLLMVLRDVASQRVSFGSGRNIGKGYLNIDKVEIQHDKSQSCIIDFREKTIDNEEFIKELLSALNRTKSREENENDM